MINKLRSSNGFHGLTGRKIRMLQAYSYAFRILFLCSNPMTSKVKTNTLKIFTYEFQGLHFQHVSR
jgi:hypothetical protein